MNYEVSNWVANYATYYDELTKVIMKNGLHNNIYHKTLSEPAICVRNKQLFKLKSVFTLILI